MARLAQFAFPAGSLPAASFLHAGPDRPLA